MTILNEYLVYINEKEKKEKWSDRLKRYGKTALKVGGVMAAGAAAGAGAAAVHSKLKGQPKQVKSPVITKSDRAVGQPPPKSFSQKTASYRNKVMQKLRNFDFKKKKEAPKPKAETPKTKASTTNRKSFRKTANDFFNRFKSKPKPDTPEQVKRKIEILKKDHKPKQGQYVT